MLKLQCNNRTILNSARTGYVGFTPAEPAPSVDEYVNLGSTEYEQSSRGVNVISLTGMPDTSTHDYLTFIFNACYYGNGLASDIMLCNNSTEWGGVMWRSRYHGSMQGIGFVGVTASVTNWTTESGQTVTSKTQDGVSYRISNLWALNDYPVIKLAVDRTNYNGYFYINNTLIGYASMNADLLTCKYIQIAKEVNSGAYPKVKNIKVAGFDTLAEAQAWT